MFIFRTRLLNNMKEKKKEKGLVPTWVTLTTTSLLIKFDGLG